MSGHPSRRQILRSTLASSGLGLAIGYPALTFAQSAARPAIVINLLAVGCRAKRDD